MIRFQCSSCGATIKANDSSAGRKGTCKRCGSAIAVPIPQSSDSSAVSDAWTTDDWDSSLTDEDPYPQLPPPQKSRLGRDKRSSVSRGGNQWLKLFFVLAGFVGFAAMALVAVVLFGRWSGVSGDAEALRDLDRSSAELKTAVNLGVDYDEYRKLVLQLSLEIDLASRKVRTPAGKHLIRLFTELLDIHVDAGTVWNVRNDIPVLRDEAEKIEKLTQSAGGRLKALLDFKTRATVNAIPMKDFIYNSTGLDEIARRYSLPITTTESEFTFIPGDSVERIFLVASKKQQEIGELQR